MQSERLLGTDGGALSEVEGLADEDGALVQIELSFALSHQVALSRVGLGHVGVEAPGRFRRHRHRGRVGAAHVVGVAVVRRGDGQVAAGQLRRGQHRLVVADQFVQLDRTQRHSADAKGHGARRCLSGVEGFRRDRGRQRHFLPCDERRRVGHQGGRRRDGGHRNVDRVGGAGGEVRVPCVLRRDGVRDPGRQVGDRQGGHAGAIQGGLAEIVAAIQEENGAAGCPTAGVDRSDNGGQGHGLAGAGLLRGGRQDGGGGRRCHALVGRAGAPGEGGAARVDGEDQVVPDGQGRGGEAGQPGHQGDGEGAVGVGEENRAGGCAGARCDGRHRGQEGDVLAEDRRVFGGDQGGPGAGRVDDLDPGQRGAGGEGRVAGVDGGDALAARQQARRAVRSHPARQGPAAQRDSVVEKDNGSRRGAGAGGRSDRGREGYRLPRDGGIHRGGKAGAGPRQDDGQEEVLAAIGQDAVGGLEDKGVDAGRAAGGYASQGSGAVVVVDEGDPGRQRSCFGQRGSRVAEGVDQEAAGIAHGEEGGVGTDDGWSLVDGLGQRGRGALVVVGVAKVLPGDAIQARSQARGRQGRLAIDQCLRAQEDAAVEEGDRSGGHAEGGVDRGREGDGTAEHGRTTRGGQGGARGQESNRVDGAVAAVASRLGGHVDVAGVVHGQAVRDGAIAAIEGSQGGERGTGGVPLEDRAVAADAAFGGGANEVAVVVVVDEGTGLTAVGVVERIQGGECSPQGQVEEDAGAAGPAGLGGAVESAGDEDGRSHGRLAVGAGEVSLTSL